MARSAAHAQKKEGDGADGPVTVKLDLATHRFDKPLPFDEEFFIVVASDKFVVQQVMYGYEDSGGHLIDTLEKKAPRILQLAGVSDQVFRIRALRANKRYAFGFVIQGMADTLVVSGKTRTSLNDYFRIDAGLLYARTLVRGTDTRVSYWGGGSNVHLYLVPLNEGSRDTPIDAWFLDPVLKRVSLFGGLAAFDLHAGVPIKPFFKGGNPVAGVSYRPAKLASTPFITEVYVNAGLMWFKQANPDPLVSDDVGKRTVIYGLAASVALRDLLGPLAFLLGGGK